MISYICVPSTSAVCSFNMCHSFFILQCMIQREKQQWGAADNLARPDGRHCSIPQRVTLSLKWDSCSLQQMWNSVTAKPHRSNGPKIRMPRVKHANQLYPKFELKRGWLRRREGECIPARMKMVIVSVWIVVFAFHVVLIPRQTCAASVCLLCPTAQECAGCSQWTPLS